MSSLDEELPDMKALHKTNDLIPDPAKLGVRVIPAEDIAGWFLPFEIVFGMVYWDTMGIYLLLAFVGTLLFGWIIPMQQRYRMLAKAEFMKEKTQLGHLLWDEQCEILNFEPILEPAFKEDAEGKIMLDEDEDAIPDDLDLEDWVTTIELEGKIIDHEDGVLTTVHTLDTRYIANLFQKMYERRLQQSGEFSTDKQGWAIKNLKVLGVHALIALKWAGVQLKQGASKLKQGGPILKQCGPILRRGAGSFREWFGAHKRRFAASVALGVVLMLFGNWIWWILSMILRILGWDV